MKKYSLFKLLALASKPLTLVQPNLYQRRIFGQSIILTRSYFETVENQPHFDLKIQT